MIAAIRRLANRDAAVAILISAVATVAALALVLTMGNPAPLIVLDLKTELLEQHVARPELSTLPLTATRFSDTGNCASMFTDGSFDGTLRPPEGARLVYNWLPAGLRVDIVTRSAAPMLLTNRDGDECQLALGSLQLMITELGVEDPAWQLPVAGPARAGSEFGSPLAPGRGGNRTFDLLREGRIDVFGKSLNGGVLFPVQSSAFVVPAGSRVVSSAQFDAEGGDPGASWYGTASYREDGLHVSATTETTELRLYRPGAGNQSEVFGVGLFAGVLADPGLALLAFAFAVFVAVTGLVGGWMGLWREPQGKPDAAPVAATAASKSAVSTATSRPPARRTTGKPK